MEHIKLSAKNSSEKYNLSQLDMIHRHRDGEDWLVLTKTFDNS